MRSLASWLALGTLTAGHYVPRAVGIALAVAALLCVLAVLVDARLPPDDRPRR